MADIPLHKPPRSANVPNSKALSSFAPRAPLKTSAEAGSPQNAPSYAYYQRPSNSSDGPRRQQAGGLKYSQSERRPNPANRREMFTTSTNDRQQAFPPTTGILASSRSPPVSPGEEKFAALGGHSRTASSSSAYNAGAVNAKPSPPVSPANKTGRVRSMSRGALTNSHFAAVPELESNAGGIHGADGGEQSRQQGSWTEFKSSPSSGSLATMHREGI